MLATQVLPDDVHENQFNEEDEPETVGFIIVGTKRHEIKKGENKIGRDPGVCSIVLDHITVSKVHAVIESEGPGDAFLYDVGSTNQTKLGRKCLKPHCRYKLDHGTTFMLGDVSAKFIEGSEFKVPQNLTQTSGDIWQSSVSCDSDIFNISTQVNVCFINKNQSSPGVGKLKGNFCLERINSDSNQFKQESQNAHNKREYKSEIVDSLEISDIFSISTQCQVQQSPKDRTENNTLGNKIGGEIEKAKSLLDDGQDDVLCNIMALHSPSSGSLEKVEIKNFISKTSDQISKSVGEDRNLVIINEHQIEPVKIASREENEDNTENIDSSTTENLTQNFRIPNVSITPENSNLETNEDLVMTQIYPLKETTQKSPSQENSNPVKDDAETEKLMCSVEVRLLEESSVLEADGENDETQIWKSSLSQGNENDDFVGTQMFPCELSHEKLEGENVTNAGKSTSPVENDSMMSSPRASQDLVETQIFETENEKHNESFKSNRSSPQELDKSSGEETESDLEILLEFDGNQKECEKLEKSPQEIKYKLDDNNCKISPKTDQDSNSSYVFEVDDPTEKNTVEFDFRDEKNKNNKEISVHFIDSDETDCSEIDDVEKQRFVSSFRETVEIPTGIESPVGSENQDQENQSEKILLTEAVENEFDRSWNELSLNMPDTQEVEGTLKKILKENEFSAERPVSKRLREGDASKEAAPCKKSKAFELPTTKATTASKKRQTDEDKQFEKLRRDHDIAQILSNRTRNSAKNVEDISNKFSFGEKSSAMPRKKSSNLWQKLEETSCASEKQTEVEASSADNLRVLRSASRKRNENQGRSSKKSTVNEISLRKGKRISKKTKPSIVFTGFESDQLDRIILELGGQKTNDLYLGEVVVTDKVRRTVKFLCAVGMGIPIASPQWLLDSKNENKFLNPWDYILKDKQSEEKWEFDLRLSLERSKRSKLLEDFNVFATENTKPPVKELLAIVECCGGVPLFGVPRVWPRKTIVVSCEEDEIFWSNVKQTRNTKIVHYEFILSGVLRQKLDFKKYKLR